MNKVFSSLIKSKPTRLCAALILSLTAALATATPSLPEGDVVTYFHSDHLGSPVAASDVNGQRLWVREYSAFGERLEGPGQGESLIGYAGHEQEDSGLSYQGARWYHPQLGRFLQPDPVGFVPANTLSANRYLYVNNNPYTYYDPDGEYLFSAIDVISISLGVASAIKNFSDGNIREGLYDVAGVAVDGVMLLAPVPGGVGLARHAARHADDAVDAGRTLARACSFAAGTPVHTPNGLAAIEDLVYGDQVLAKNEATGNLTYKPILDAYSHAHTDGLKLVVGFDATNTETIVATGEHPFYVLGQGFTRADELQVGQRIATHTRDTVEVLEVDLSPIELVAYNYTVEDYETYFVGEFGLWVHNACDLKTPVVSSNRRAPEVNEPNSIWEQVKPDGSVMSRTYYDSNGRQFSRQDFEHSHGGMRPHEHNREFDSTGRPITREETIQLPEGYDNSPTLVRSP